MKIAVSRKGRAGPQLIWAAVHFHVRVYIRNNMNKKLPAYISFLLFISLIALFILEIAGQSNLLSVSATEYLDFLRHGQILIVSAVIIFVSLGVARIATSGLFRKVASVKEIFAKRIFWLSFSIFLFVQIIGIYMLRAINIEQP